MKECPFCAEQIQDKAVKCKHCGSDLAPDTITDRSTGREGFLPGLELAGRYRILEELGRGGMGIVYRARDLELEQDVAVKVLPAEVAGDEQAVATLRDEAKLCLALTHPNIVRLYDFKNLDGHYCLVMEYVGGGSLAQLLFRHRQGLPEEKAIHYITDMCRGLQYAHRHKVMHRDIKPANILLGTSGETKISDFGIARVIRDTITHLTGNLTTGTLAYMSPEQLRGQMCDARSDIYSLGVTLYQLLTGAPPFTTGDITYQHLHEPPPRPDRISPWLWAILERMMAKDPSDRFASLEKVLTALDSHSAGAPPPLRKAPPPARVSKRPVKKPSPPPARKKSLLPVILGAAGVIVGGIVLLGIVSGGDGDRPSPAPPPAIEGPLSEGPGGPPPEPGRPPARESPRGPGPEHPPGDFLDRRGEEIAFENRRLEDDRRRLEEEARRLEADRLRVEEETRRREEEARVREKQRVWENAARKAEDQFRRAEENARRAEAQQRWNDRRRWEEEARTADRERRKAEGEIGKLEAAWLKGEQIFLVKEAKRFEQERLRARGEAERATQEGRWDERRHWEEEARRAGEDRRRAAEDAKRMEGDIRRLEEEQQRRMRAPRPGPLRRP